MKEGILEVRMVPVGQMFDRLSRIIRKVSRNLGKDIQFVVSGADTEVDKLIIEELSDPLMHIIRNAIDHGIEETSKRVSVGKPDMGTIALTAYQKGNHVVIEIEDDGAGIDCSKLVEVAVKNGNITREQADSLQEHEILNLIFLPGLSTASKATEISGRGVGMDIVKTNIASLGGIVEVQSELGIGTKFSITMPVTLAITPALLVTVSDNTYAIPLNTIAEALTIDAKEINRVMNTETMTLRGQTLPLCRMNTFFNIKQDKTDESKYRIVVASLGQHKLGLVVDALIGQQDVIIKPLGESVAKDAGCFVGVTDMGENRLALVLDTAYIIEDFFISTEEEAII
jgi:two-component system chemotaxis sensor kinase CheA